MVDLQTTGAPLRGLLEIEQHDGEWKAWIEGGPAPLTMGDDTITIDVDSRDIRGFIFIRRLVQRHINSVIIFGLGLSVCLFWNGVDDFAQRHIFYRVVFNM